MKRLDLGMTQKELADYMGASQGMVSKWESREYNFTITTLNELCEKLGLVFDPIIKEPEVAKFDQIKFKEKTKSQLRKISKYTSNENICLP